MNKETIGAYLVKLRKNKVIKDLSPHKIISVQTGRSSYPVSSLLAYCDNINVQVAITDIALNEVYPIDDITGMHDILAMLMERYHEDARSLFRKTGVTYTTPKSNTVGMSIDSLLKLLTAFGAKLDFVQIN